VDAREVTVHDLILLAGAEKAKPNRFKEAIENEPANVQ
jgi:hypothetical protein